VLSTISLLLWCAVGAAGAYLWFLALASIRASRGLPPATSTHRFAIAVPAHDEEAVIGQTVATLRQQRYPAEMYDIFVVADHCTDRTVEAASNQGATCLERDDGPRGGKGQALRWLFERIFTAGTSYDAVVVFDADTQVDAGFLSVMNARLAAGAKVVQGRHVISNPREGWFPALTWAMMTIDNRYHNQGRIALGLSAKHMGDSICFRSDVLRSLGWGSGLTEDYEFRLRLLLEGIRIQYEPRAVGYGQAPPRLKEAQAQRSRWLKGTADARKRYRKELLRQGLHRGDWAMLDGALGSSMPSYSTLALVSAIMFLCHIALSGQFWPILAYLWGITALTWFAYPLLGLALEKSLWWGYVAVLSGPVFMLWRTWLSLRVRWMGRSVTWVRTSHKGSP
jgi:cellulose synthase/poly-beta-1,6-N-acetylglucosamine synthase-like glycosyltransferase